MDLKFLRGWLVLAHWVVEAALAFGEVGWDQEEVGLGRGDDPLGIVTHINALNRITKPRQQGLGILANLLVKADGTVHRTDGQATFERGGDLVEHRVSLIRLLHRLLDFVINTRIQSENCSIANTNQLLARICLPISNRGRQMVNLREVRIIGSPELLHNFASLQVKIKELGCVVGVGEDEPIL